MYPIITKELTLTSMYPVIAHKLRHIMIIASILIYHLKDPEIAKEYRRQVESKLCAT